jgi:hypothetical protein
MKIISLVLVPLVTLTLVIGAAGCATSKEKLTSQQREVLLESAGFKAIPATAPDQQRLMRTLPADRVSAVRRRGELYFAYPVLTRNLLYVGKNSQYLAYQQAVQLKKEDSLVKEEVESINRSMSSPGWEAPWGDWDAL